MISKEQGNLFRSLKTDRRIVFVSLLFVGNLVFFQNCDKPYELAVQDTTTSESELTEFIGLQPDALIDGQAYVTRPELHLILNRKYAEEMIISESSDCIGEWEIYKPEIKIPWDAPNGVSSIFMKFRNFSKEESQCFREDFIFDDSPPELAFVKAPGAVSPVASPLFKIESLDHGGEIVKVEFSLNGDPWQELQQMPEEAVSELQLNDLANGSYSLAVRALDKAGHASEVLTHEWDVQVFAPILELVSAPERFTRKTKETIHFQGTSNPKTGLRVVRYTCQLDRSEQSECRSPYSVTTLIDGKHTVTVRAFDENGNYSSQKHEWILDTTGPALSITAGPGSVSRLSDPLFKIQAIDEGAGVDSYECKVDSEPFMPCSPNSIIPRDLTDGPHQFQARAFDRAGNVSAVQSYGWAIDNTAPFINFIATPPKKSNLSTVEFMYRFEDEGASLVAKVECRLNSSNYEACGSTSKTFSNIPSGRNKFELRITDDAGNTRVDSYLFEVDRIPPSLIITRKPAAITGEPDATFFYESKDENGVATTECSIDDANFESCNQVNFIRHRLNDGKHNFRVRVTDTFGNTKTLRHEWVVDTSPPVITSQSVPTKSYAGIPFQIKFSYQDEAPVRVKCYANDTQVTDATHCTSSYFYHTVNTVEENYKLQIVLQDTLGNVERITVFKDFVRLP